MTLEEVLKMVVNNLSGINVPVALMKQIATPITQAIENINACLDAMNRDAHMQEESQEPESPEPAEAEE